MYFNCIVYNEAFWLFCGYYDEGLRNKEIGWPKY